MFAPWLAPRLSRLGIHYGWMMVALTFLTSISTAGLMGLPGVLITPLKAEYGWNTSDISGALGLRLVLFGLIAPFAAAFIARHGIRVMVGVALVLMVAGLALTAWMTQLWQLWLGVGVLIGVGSGLTALVLGATVASRWFTARRGLVVGILTASNATGQLAFLPLGAWLIDQGGWQLALLPPTVLIVLSCALMQLFGVEYPAKLGLAPFGETAIVPVPPRPSHNPFTTSIVVLREAAGSTMFWVLFFTFFVCGLSTNGLVGSHFVPLCQDFGMEAVAAAGVLAMIGAFDFVGTIVSGWLSDRYDNRWLLFAYYGLRGLSLMALPYSEFSFVGLTLFGVFYGLDWVATVPPTVRLSASTFGRDKAPMVFGWVFTAHQLGAAVAATGGGIVRDNAGSYLPAFFAAGVACVIAALSVVAIRGRARPVVAASAA